MRGLHWNGKPNSIDGMPISEELSAHSKQTLIRASLRKCHLFGDLSGPELEEVSETCALKHLSKGEYLFHESEKAEGFFLVQSGSINLHRLTSSGQEQVLHIFRPYDVFAEITLTTFETYPANAVALEESQVILIRKRAFKELIMRKPELSLRMLTSMSFHLKDLIQMIEDLKFKQIESRLANWLLRHIPASAASEEQPVVRLDLTKKVLASKLGVASETFSRTLAKFRGEELIEVEGPEIRLLDIEGLRRHIDD
jgi:CRP/FNR family transcriptional regulator